MIFVTVGNGPFPFKRLLKEMDRIASEIDEEVLMQIGVENNLPEYANYFCFISKNEIEKIYKKSRIIICHAGIGSIISCIKYNKPGIVVPRIVKYGEIFDEHQMQIAHELKKNKMMGVVFEVKNLRKEIEAIENNIRSDSDKKKNLIRNIKNYFSSFNNNN